MIQAILSAFCVYTSSVVPYQHLETQGLWFLNQITSIARWTSYFVGLLSRPWGNFELQNIICHRDFWFQCLWKTFTLTLISNKQPACLLLLPEFQRENKIIYLHGNTPAYIFWHLEILYSEGILLIWNWWKSPNCGYLKYDIRW